ncbi:MAG TPA: 4Fe-4S dicluster domain-containing protein [Lacunisphaera sp.]|nr:4Fe-4S dicluster domain-containing protein [Lacunisphaera sp.]
MRRRGLKILRVALAAVVFAGLAAAFLDFRGLVPAPLAHWLAAIQFVPALVVLATGGAAVAAVVIVVATLAFGRVYCAVVCPLGIAQDVIGWIARAFHLRRRLLPFARANNGLRYGVLVATLATLAVGGASIASSHTDPYSNFGRVVSGLFRPVIVAANNALVTPATALGFAGLYRVNPPWPAPAILWPALVVLVLVTALAVWRGRIYCNTLCPVGTVLGLMAGRSAFRLRLDRSACSKCAECLRTCKAQCIDLRAGAIDASRCVACYNCIDACAQHGIAYRWSWGRDTAGPVRVALPDLGRRAFLANGSVAIATAAGANRLLAGSGPGADEGKSSRAICPPGAGGIDRFVERCTACQLCVSACPTHVLQPALGEYGFPGFMKPRLDYTAAFCNFDCQRCAEVCPAGAIARQTLAAKQVTRIGLARLDLDQCIVKTKGTDCAACSEHCPTKAVDTVPYGDGLRLPQVTDDLCIGCGACEYACPALPHKAIKVTGRRWHEVAVKRMEGKARDPRKGGGFPF